MGAGFGVPVEVVEIGTRDRHRAHGDIPLGFDSIDGIVNVLPLVERLVAVAAASPLPDVAHRHAVLVQDDDPSVHGDAHDGITFREVDGWRDPPSEAQDSSRVRVASTKSSVTGRRGHPDCSARPRSRQGAGGRDGLRRKAAGTVRAVVNVLRSVCAFSIDAGATKSNVCDKIALSRPPRSEMRFLDADEVARLAATIDSRFRVLVLFACYTRSAPGGSARSVSVEWTSCAVESRSERASRTFAERSSPDRRRPMPRGQ